MELTYTFGSKKISTQKKAFVMAILNSTPDSFYEKSRGGLEKALKLIEDGAEILDFGGESTRPGFLDVSEDEELNRVIPLIYEIRKRSDVVISIDTRKSNVAKKAYEAGADLLNDVSFFEYDKKMIDFLLASNMSAIFMHPGFSEKENSLFKNEEKTEEKIIKKVNEKLMNKIEFFLKNGFSEEKIFVDPGIGFGKDFFENISLIKNCGSLCEGKYPVIMALSRKRCIGQMTQNEVDDRLSGTLAANIRAVQNGATILRVHDVKETVDTLNVMKYI